MPAFLFDLDGTLVDSVYQHVLAWREALEKTGIELAAWFREQRIRPDRFSHADRVVGQKCNFDRGVRKDGVRARQVD